MKEIVPAVQVQVPFKLCFCLPKGFARSNFFMCISCLLAEELQLE